MIYDSRDEFFMQLLVDYVLLNEILSGPFSDQCIQKIGIKYGLKVEDQYRSAGVCGEKLTTAEFAELVAMFFNSVGGEYTVKACDAEKVVLTCYGCPFGHLALKSPLVCEIFVGVAGGIAARNFPYSKVSVEHSIARKSSNCQLVVYLAETESALRAKGTEFHNDPTSYLLTRNEIQTISEEILSSNNVYSKYAQSLENLQSIHRDMETEYNQLRNEIFSDLRLGVMTVNDAGKITYLNKAAQDLLGIENHWDTYVTKEFQSLLKNTVTQSMRYSQHLIQVPFPGASRFYSVNTAPLFKEGETVSGAVSVFQDVTEKKQLETEMLNMEKFSLVAELAAGTAHEIRNPMTTLRGFLQILSKEFKPDTKGHEYCSLMIEEIDRANTIIKEFLLLTKPAAPKLREADLHVTLEEIFILIESKSLLENVELQKRYTKSLPLVKVDPAQIKQVFLNLATNAIQAMPSGGHLVISTAADRGKARVSFTDTGCGLEEAQLAKIFDPFFTTKEDGTGLGLTISYRIIENHGGRLSAVSTPGKGTTFTVELPAVSE
ncbi:MAG: ATP-binding protein [Bacillota bacterium]|nr:ATP-binding protein [Bacillota bacterium]MDW7683039.1 ATP-binding protein [Bacillota bacterium]